MHEKLKRLHLDDPVTFRFLDIFFWSGIEKEKQRAASKQEKLQDAIAAERKNIQGVLTPHDATCQRLAEVMAKEFAGFDFAMGALKRWDRARTNCAHVAKLGSFTQRDLTELMEAERQLAWTYAAVSRRTANISRTEF